MCKDKKNPSRTTGRASASGNLTQDDVAEAADDGPQAGDEERPRDLLDSPHVLVLLDGIWIDGDGVGRVGVGARPHADLVPVFGRRGVGRQKWPDEESAEQEADPDHGVERVREWAGLVRAHGVHDDAGVGRDEGAEEDVLHAAHRDQHAECPEKRENADDQAAESDRAPDED